MLRMCHLAGILLLVSTPITMAAPNAVPENPTHDWVDAARKVHQRFTGQKGTFAHFGDSITYTFAFWTPLLYNRKNASPELEKAFDLVKATMRPECWRDWKGPEFGNESGRTADWALANLDGWLKRLNPE